MFQWFLKLFAFWGALMAFEVCVLRPVVDVSCLGGQVEAFRGVSEAFGGHFGSQKPSNTIEKPRFVPMVFGKRRFRSLVSFRSLLELGYGAFLGLL